MIRIESNAAYHASSPLSKSRLFEMRRSPEWFRFCEEHPSAQTDAMLFGSLFHKLVLEPDGIDAEYLVMPSIDRRTKAGRELFEEFTRNAGERSIVTQEMLSLASAMRDAVRRNPTSDFLTSGGDVEQSIYFTDPPTGIECKARPDVIRMVGEKRLIVDLKSCRSAATEDFRRDAIQLGYDLQAAMYCEAVRQEYGEICSFVFIAVEKEPPHLLNVIQCDELFLKRGYDLFREYLGMYKECSESGNWYGLCGAFNIINELHLPSWLSEQYE